MNQFENMMIMSTSKELIADINVYVLGDGGFAGEIKQLLQDIGFTNIYLYGKEQIFPLNECRVVGVSNPSIKEKLYSDIYSRYYLNIIHPSVDNRGVTFGKGNIICKGCSLTTNITLGNCNAINLNCTIGHDVKIGNFNQINPGVNISGGVTIGNKCLIGTGVQILENISICNNVIIGAGAVVTKSIHESGTYVGVPARIKK